MKTLGTILMVMVGFMFNSKTDKATNSIEERQTVATVQDVKGIIWKVEDNTYMIECAEKHLKLNAINLPEKFRGDNVAVTFSGNLKATHPMEDNWGNLFEVTAITN